MHIIQKNFYDYFLFTKTFTLCFTILENPNNRFLKNAWLESWHGISLVLIDYVDINYAEIV